MNHSIYTKNMPRTAFKRADRLNNTILIALCGGFGYLVVLGLLDMLNGAI